VASDLAEGMRLLRRAATLKLVAAAIGIAASLLMLPLPLAALLRWGLAVPRHRPPSPADVMPLLATLLAPGLTALASLIVDAVATYGFLIPSSTRLARWRGELATSSKLMKVGYWGALAAGLLAAALLAAGLLQLLSLGAHPAWSLGAAAILLLSGVGLLLLALLLLFVGWVGLLLFLFGLSSSTGIRDFKTSAILMIMAAAITLLAALPLLSVAMAFAAAAINMVAWYLAMASAGRGAAQQPSAPQQQGQ